MLCEHRIKLAMGQMLVEGGRLQDNLARAVEMIAQAGRQGCQIAVLPECLDLGWAHPAAGQLAAEIPGPATAMLGQAASDARLHVVAGLTERDGSKTYNSAVLIDASGRVLLKHRKINLLDIEQGVYCTGDRLSIAETACGVIGVNTHTGPVFREGDYKIPKEGAIQPTEYAQFFVDRMSEAAAKAWQDRQRGAVAWGLGHAVVGQNRRAVYADGRAVMYGRTDQPDFRGLEGYEDHAVEVLFFFDSQEKLLAAAINLACTAQEVESHSAVNADFFHEVREALREKHGRDLKILGWIGAAGDQSPHLMFRQRAEDRMRELRDLTRLQEIARRVVAAFDEAYDGAKKEIHNDVALAHRVARLDLPVRMVTDEEATAAKAKVESLSKDPANQTLVGWHQGIVDRHANQKSHPTHEVEIHVLRLGDVAIATNPFELFVDFGVQIKARSPALQTFVVQLVGVEGYLPTARAVRGGGYSAIAESNTVGPEGGQVLVDRTVDLVKSLWQEPKR